MAVSPMEMRAWENWKHGEKNSPGSNKRLLDFEGSVIPDTYDLLGIKKTGHCRVLIAELSITGDTAKGSSVL